MIFNIFHHNKCNYVRNRLSEYIDARVNPRESALIEEHLASCNDCRKECDSLRKTVGLLRQVQPASVPHSFAIARVRPVPYPSFFRSLRIASVMVAVMLTLVIMGDVTKIIPGLSGASSPSPILSATSSPVAPGSDVMTKVSDNTATDTGLGQVVPPLKVGQEGPAPQGVQEDTSLPAASTPGGTASSASPTVPEGLWWLRSVELILIAVLAISGTMTLFIWQRYKKIYS